jgi:predicted negative regulator of RcsB-dependent stress response
MNMSMVAIVMIAASVCLFAYQKYRQSRVKSLKGASQKRLRESRRSRRSMV